MAAAESRIIAPAVPRPDRDLPPLIAGAAPPPAPARGRASAAPAVPVSTPGSAPAAPPPPPPLPVPVVVPGPAPPPPYDPSVDPAIKALLDQQAEIQAKLAALLPQKYGPNIKAELEMLRHKLRVLRAYADDNRESCVSFPFHLSSPTSLDRRLRSPASSVSLSLSRRLWSPFRPLSHVRPAQGLIHSTPDLSDRIPLLSEIEEARALQYYCECIEAAFLDQGGYPAAHCLPATVFM